ncbi:MAG: response regulator [Candidatus Omnitrophica bacterium]|nr:response regulator [Candidatus Omnitrophota bacterium]
MKAPIVTALLIEDRPADVDVVKQALAKDTSATFDLIHVDRLSPGLQRLSRGGIDVILLDLMLPDTKGLDALTAILQLSDRVPVVILTASDDEGLASAALQAGADDYLVKGHLEVYPYLLGRAMRYAIERKRAEADLLAAHTQTEQLLSAVPSILIRLSLDGRVTHWNAVAEEVFGIAEVTVSGRLLADAGIAWDAGQVLGGLSACQLADRPASLEHVALARPNGQERILQLTIVPIHDAAARLSGFLLFGTDVTERRKTEAERLRLQTELSEAQKLETIGRFAWGIAHDFQNFLQVILGFAWLMRGRCQEQPELQNDLNEIVHAAESASGMIRQLLAFSRRQALKPTVLELNQTLRNLERVLQQFVGDRIDVGLSLPKESLLVKLDPTALEQILINLASNARDSMPDAGRLTISSGPLRVDAAFAAGRSGAKPGDYIRLSVQDTGTGMDPTIVPHIFEPFFTTKQQGKGAGLGMAVVYGLVKQHEGFIDIETALGRGTTFHLYFPRQHALGQAANGVAPAVAARVRAILVIEPEEQDRRFAEEILREGGYRVLTEAATVPPLDMVKRHAQDADAIIVDLSIGQEHGEALMMRIRAVAPAARVLLISGLMDQKLRTLTGAVEGVRVLQKPYLPAQLLGELRELLQPSEPKPDGLRVLVVDDDPAIRRMCERMLAGLCRVTVASSSPEAIVALERAPYDVLLTDLIMPQMDGVELIAQATRRWPSLRIAVMSGSLSDQLQTRLAATRAPMTVLQKPFTASGLRALMTQQEM